MALQLREPKQQHQLSREQALVEEHAEAWIGKLTRITTWIEFERGFLARCGLGSAPAWAIGMPEWATVEHIGLSDGWSRDFARLVAHPIMRSLVSLRVSSRVVTSLLPMQTSTRIRKLIVDGTLTPETRSALAAAPMFRNLELVDVRG